MSEWMITSSILILLIIGIRSCVKNKIALRARYALWLVVALRLLVPVSFSESSFSVLNFLGGEILPAVQEGIPGKAEGQGAAVMGQKRREIFSEEMRAEEEAGGRLPGGPAADRAVPDYMPAAGKEGVSAETSPDRSLETGFISDPRRTGVASGVQEVQLAGRLYFGWKKVLLCIWLSGAAVIAGTVFLINRGYRRRLYGSRKKCRAGMRSILPVYTTPAVLTPCMFGLFRPAVYLTPGIECDDKSLKYVLYHENIHYLHRDHLWALVRAVCVCVHWYNPLVWIAAELSRQDCELACDEKTLTLLDEEDRIDYGRTLLNLSVQSDALPGGLRLSTAVSGGKRRLKERLLMIISHPRRTAVALPATMALVLMVSAFTFTDRVSGQKTPEDEPGETVPEIRAADRNGADGIQNTSIVTIDLNDGKDYTLKIIWEDGVDGTEYQIERLELNWIHDKKEEMLQSVSLDEVKVLYTMSQEDVRANGGRMWPYTPEKEVLYAKPLRSADDLSGYDAEAFLAEGSGPSLEALCDGGILVEDLNFDGYQDFCLRGRGSGENVPYYCYLWNPEIRQYEPRYMIPNICVNKDTELIESACEDGEDVYSIKYYRFDENDVLHMTRYVEKDKSPDAVLPALDLTYCETGYALPAVDEWDYGTRYGGALTERMVWLARKALTELYEWSGTRLESVCFSVTEFGEVVFGNTPKDMDASRTFYHRCYSGQAEFEDSIRHMTLLTERVVWYSPVVQWNVPKNLDGMTDEEVVLWYFAFSALAGGETAETIEETVEDDYVIKTAEGHYFEASLNPLTREISSIYGPYDDFPLH